MTSCACGQHLRLTNRIPTVYQPVASLRAGSEQDMLGRAPWASTRPGAVEVPVEVVSVPVSTLDAHLPPPRAALLLKIDAQGHGSCVGSEDTAPLAAASRAPGG